MAFRLGSIELGGSCSAPQPKRAIHSIVFSNVQGMVFDWKTQGAVFQGVIIYVKNIYV